MEFEFYSSGNRRRVDRNNHLVDSVRDERRSRWPNRPRGPSNARSPCSPPSATGAARISPTVPGSAISRRVRHFGSCARWRTTGFVSKEEFGTYRPGSRLIQLGAQALSNESLVDFARPVMEKLVAETGESAYLSVEGHGGTGAVHQHRRGHPLGPARQAGSVEPSPSTFRRRGTRCAAASPTRGTSSSNAAWRPTSPRSPARCIPRRGSSLR